MKIAFVGKGGSGKTTLSALVARTLAQRALPVMAIDADINQHLGRALGMLAAVASAIPPLGLEIVRIKEYLRGENPRIANPDSMIKTTPPGHGSRFLKLSESNPLFDYFSRDAEGVHLMAVGPFDEADLGIHCYHSKTGAVELILNHLIDQPKEYVLVDMTAGADSFASGLFTRFDVTFLVVEPTIKSVSVYEQYKKYARDFAVTIKVIGNKVSGSDDVDFLRTHAGADMVAAFPHSEFVRHTDRGTHLPITEIEMESTRALDAVIECIDSQQKDWKKFYDQALEFHRKNAQAWANEATGHDLAAQIDPTFTITETLLM